MDQNDRGWDAAKSLCRRCGGRQVSPVQFTQEFVERLVPARTEPHALKARLGDRVSFWGAIDQQGLLPNGTPDEIDRAVAAAIEALGAGGGYMCAPAHIIQADTSMENVEAFIRAVQEYGVYGK